jgi:hypothetical protein
LFWSWDFRQKRPILIEDDKRRHNCSSGKDIFPGWCDTCKAPDLVFLRKEDRFELHENYGLMHTCPQPEPDDAIQNISSGKCRLCNTDNLLWIYVKGRYSLVDKTGQKHNCGKFGALVKDWAEAKRINYAMEKKWINSFPEGHVCKRCKGKRAKDFYSKNKKILAKFNTTEPILMRRPCFHCKQIGIFTIFTKANYLRELRKKYWPFKGGVHKWKRRDKLSIADLSFP